MSEVKIITWETRGPMLYRLGQEPFEWDLNVLSKEYLKAYILYRTTNPRTSSEIRQSHEHMYKMLHRLITIRLEEKIERIRRINEKENDLSLIHI